MIIRSASLLQGFLSLLLIVALVSPSILVPQIAKANLGGGADGSGGFDSGIGEGPDGGGGSDGGDGDGAGDSDSDGDGASDGVEGAASAAAAEGVAANAEAMGVDGLSVSPADNANDPESIADPDNPEGTTVSVNGVEMSVAAANEAISAMAEAQSLGISAATEDAPGYNVDATLAANSMEPGVGVVGNMTGTVGSAQAVAAAETDAAIGLSTATAAATDLGIADSFGFDPEAAAAAAAADVNDALSVAAAHPALMDQTPIAQQSYAFSPPSVTAQTISTTPVMGVTPTQSFNTNNPVVDATNFSLGTFAPGMTTSPQAAAAAIAADDEATMGYMGMAIGRMATQKAMLDQQLTQLSLDTRLNALDAFIDQSVPTSPVAQMAQVEAVTAQIAAIDARMNAMIDPTVTNDAVAALSQQKANELSAMAQEVAAQADIGQLGMAQNTMDALDARAESYDSRISAAEADVATAQTEVDNASKLGIAAVDVALGLAPTPTGVMTAEPTSAIASLGISLGMNPASAHALSATISAMTNAVIDAMPVTASVAALADYADAKTMANELGLAAQAETDDAIGLGVADSFGFGVSSKAAAQAVNATQMDAVATQLGYQAVATIAMDTMGMMSFAPTAAVSLADNAISLADNAVSTATTAAAPTAASVAPTAQAAQATSPNVSISYDAQTNTVTVGPVSTAASSVAEGRFSAATADNASTPTGLASAADSTVGPAANDNAAPANTGNNPGNPNAAGYQGSSPGPAGMADDAPGTAGTAAAAADNAGPAAAANDNAPGNTGNNPGNPNAAGYQGSTPGPTASAANDAGPTGLAAAADDASTPSTAADDSSVPGVTADDALSPPAPAAAPTVTPTNVTAAVMAVVEALSMPVAPASIAQALVDTVTTAISRTAEDISPTNPTTISINNATNNTTPTAPTAQTAAPTQAPSTVAPNVSVTPATAVPAAQNPTAPSVVSVPGVTAPTAPAVSTAPGVTSPTTATQAPTDATPAAPSVTAPAATISPSTPAAPAEVGPASYASVEQAAPAVNPSPIGETISNFGEGVANAFNELFGVQPAVSDPIGVTQNNPTNIRENTANSWVGEVDDGARSFETFEAPEYGFRAAYLIQQSYQKAGATTVRARIEKWAPAFENPNLTSYINHVADHMGITPDTAFDIMDKEQAIDFVEAMTQFEVGTNHPFTRAQMEQGFELARAGSQNTPTVSTPAAQQVPQEVAQVAQEVVKTAATIAEYSPTAIAVRAGIGFLDQYFAAEQAPTAPANPAVANPSTATTPSTATQPTATNPAPQAESPVLDRVVLQNQNATHRKLDITDTLRDQLTYAAEQANVTFVITSGGQASKADIARGLAKLTDRTGSNRHDHGNAADGHLVDSTGRVLSFTNPNDLPTFRTFIREAVKAGVTGVGAGIGYMGPSTIHVGGGSALAWGKGGKTANAPTWLREVHQQGLEDAKSFDLAEYQAAQEAAAAQTVATPPQTTPTAQPTAPTQVAPTTPTVVPVTVEPTAPVTPPSTPVAAPTTPAVAQPSTPPSPVATPNSPSSPSGQTANDSTGIPSSNTGNPPDNLGNVGPGTSPTPTSLSPIATTRAVFLGFIGSVVTAINNALGTDIAVPGEENNEVTGAPTTPIQTGTTPGTDPASPAGLGSPLGPSVTTPANQINDPSGSLSPTNTSTSTAATTSPATVNVLIQIDGNTGDMYFDIDGVYDSTGQLYADHESYDEVEPENEAEASSEVTKPRIILDDQRLNVIYSDGTYAPVTMNGIVYRSLNDPNYVYTVEYYKDGKLVPFPDNGSALPQGNALTNVLQGLFESESSYGISDVRAVTRALIDPDENVPADEYYSYRIYLVEGGTRETTVPRYTSHRYMSERFAETGFVGDVLNLIAGSVEIPPPSSGKGFSGIVKTLKDIGLSALDLFRGDESEDSNPIVTDFGNLVPSDDGEITMNDLKTVIVLLDVDAECPYMPGLDRPYLYEIVIAQSAISGAASDQAFRAVRCGGGDKADYVEQVASHFETFDGVGSIDREQLAEMIRFANFKDLDMSKLIADTSKDNASTSTPAVVPEDAEENFTPNITNEITFEVKAVDNKGETLLDWTDEPGIRVDNGVQLFFRWNGSAYQQCLPFLNDSGDYALRADNRAMVTGNTESDRYDVREASTTYSIECGGQRNNEFGVDNRSIRVIVE